ncbi:hypothetical protein HWB57_gp034 [Erwinia phage vB_EamM-Bue1]|uniref:Uncharacterized protein n=1 Tax=Erwinia phage vB_EamM-Bue1 TaxID=2099338 RepID=A0A2P1JU66_9CAUD|nr:hypothetical protein HWB57_gp034 [Erwinia phage vB_EamM-Bue1]AVO22877.1 hypothetical protein [Erwinia phage vB_EamM-Bue1]
MQCKCGGNAHRAVEQFTNQKTAQEASGRPVKRLPVTVVKDRCGDCGREDTQLWYTPDSKPVARGILQLFNKQ